MYVTRYVFPYRVADRKYLLINSLTGAVDLVGGEVLRAFSAIRHGSEPDLSRDALEHLVERGYLYANAQDEKALVDRALAFNEAIRARDQALCFVLCPTVSCNLRCPYCFEPHALHASRKVMTDAQVGKAFEALDRLRLERPDIPRSTINLFGGEPLQEMTRGPVRRMLDEAATRDLPVSITTNGSNVDRLIDILRPHRERILLDVSLDGLKDIHDRRRFDAEGAGTFDRIAENVDLLLADGFGVAVRMNVDEQNIDGVSDFLAFVRDKAWHRYRTFQLNVSPVTNYTGNGRTGIMPPSQVERRLSAQVPKDLLDVVPMSFNGDISRLTMPLNGILGTTAIQGEYMPSIYYCEASGALFYCMGPDGFVYPCNQILGDPEWAIGRYDPTLSIDPAKAAMWHGRKVTNMPKCLDCSLAFSCAGGCPVMAKRTSGSPTNSYCGTSKSELAAFIRDVAPVILERAGALETC